MQQNVHVNDIHIYIMLLSIGPATCSLFIPYVNVVCLPYVSRAANALATEDCRGVQLDQGQFGVTHSDRLCA